VLKNQAKNQFKTFEHFWTKKTFFSRSSTFPQSPENNAQHLKKMFLRVLMRICVICVFSKKITAIELLGRLQ
jgi:hypothetical protein